MKYQITEEQRQKIVNTLAEFPAKHVYNDIVMLQNLQKIEESDTIKEDTPKK